MKRTNASPLDRPPVMPRALDAAAGEVWREIVPQLLAADVGVCSIDSAAIAAYCEITAMLRRLEESVSADGLTLEDAQGRRYRNPIVDAARDYRRLQFELAEELGLTPRSRKRIREELRGGWRR